MTIFCSAIFTALLQKKKKLNKKLTYLLTNTHSGVEAQFCFCLPYAFNQACGHYTGQNEHN